MKKILAVLVLLLCVSFAHAQMQTYKTTSFALAKVYNGQYVWGDWERSDMYVTFDLDRDVIKIYSPVTQVYKIYDSYNNGQFYYDSSYGRQVKFYVLDQDFNRGNIRLRVEKNGNSQIYIDFSDYAWCYNVYRIR